MRISVEARASATAASETKASVVIDASGAAPPADRTRGRIASSVATIVGVAGAVSSLPELSARLPARVVMTLHFIAMVGGSAQPLVIALAAAAVASMTERRRRHDSELSS
jgi:hypothetical protein